MNERFRGYGHDKEFKRLEIEELVDKGLRHAFMLSHPEIPAAQVAELPQETIYTTLNTTPRDPESFHDLGTHYPEHYHSRNIVADVEAVERIMRPKRDAYNEMSPEVKEKKAFALRIGLLNELLIAFQIRHNLIFGKDAHEMKTVVYDDLGGDDLGVLFGSDREKQNNPEAMLVLGLDSTVVLADEIEGKMRGIKESIERGTLGTIRYGHFEDEEENVLYRGPLELVPVVVIGATSEKIANAVSLWAERQNRTLKDDITVTIILKEIVMQLQAYAAYARELCNNIPVLRENLQGFSDHHKNLFREWETRMKKIPARYEMVLEKISPLLSARDTPIDDGIFSSIRRHLYTTFQQPITEETFRSIIDGIVELDRERGYRRERAGLASVLPIKEVEPVRVAPPPRAVIEREELESPQETRSSGEIYQDALAGLERMKQAQNERAEKRRRLRQEREESKIAVAAPPEPEILQEAFRKTVEPPSPVSTQPEIEEQEVVEPQKKSERGLALLLKGFLKKGKSM